MPKTRVHLAVPYFQQDTDYTCGPASLQMVLAYYGIRTSEDKLRRALRTSEDEGSRHQRMIDTALSHKLSCYVNEDAPMDELVYLLMRRIPPIIHYQEIDENIGHYSVVVGMDDHKIFLNDPWHGERLSFSHGAFTKRWMCAPEDGTCKSWLMGVSDKPFQIGRHFLPKQ